MDRIFILDRSGSMDSCRDDTIGGFNSLVNDQKALGGTMTLIQFDHDYLVSYDSTDINEVSPLTTETFQPRGSTALLDAIGKTLKLYGDKPVATVVILTDGQENASKEYTKAHIKDLIDQKTKDGWTFMYVGANQDAFAEAGSMGIDQNCTMNYDTRRTPELFARLSATLSQSPRETVAQVQQSLL